MLTGVAGLVAGAISMGLGEYTSVRSQNEQVGAEVAKERRELERHPDAEAKELADAWVARGLPRDLADQVADVLRQNPDEALRVHVREELGVDPDDRAEPVDRRDLLVPLLLGRRAGPAAAVPARVRRTSGSRSASAAPGCSRRARSSPGSPAGGGGPAACASSLLGAAAAGATYRHRQPDRGQAR